jgi:hypothetical protein
LLPSQGLIDCRLPLDRIQSSREHDSRPQRSNSIKKVLCVTLSVQILLQQSQMFLN